MVREATSPTRQQPQESHPRRYRLTSPRATATRASDLDHRPTVREQPLDGLGPSSGIGRGRARCRPDFLARRTTSFQAGVLRIPASGRHKRDHDFECRNVAHRERRSNTPSRPNRRPGCACLGSIQHHKDFGPGCRKSTTRKTDRFRGRAEQDPQPISSSIDSGSLDYKLATDSRQIGRSGDRE